jgi:hypothetical protein
VRVSFFTLVLTELVGLIVYVCILRIIGNSLFK